MRIPIPSRALVVAAALLSSYSGPRRAPCTPTFVLCKLCRGCVHFALPVSPATSIRHCADHSFHLRRDVLGYVCVWAFFLRLTETVGNLLASARRRKYLFLHSGAIRLLLMVLRGIRNVEAL